MSICFFNKVDESLDMQVCVVNAFGLFELLGLEVDDEVSGSIAADVLLRKIARARHNVPSWGYELWGGPSRERMEFYVSRLEQIATVALQAGSSSRVHWC